MSGRLRVLVVEDNPADVELVREYLSDSGFISFQIDSVSRLSEAIARLEGENFDLLLIDLGLPDSRGLDTFHNLRKAAPNTPVIILTGHDDEGTAITAVRNGAQDYLIKGEIIGNTLVRAAQYGVERKRAEVELQERESKLKTLFELLPVGVSILDAQRKISFMNFALERILEISREGLLRGDYENRTYLRPDGTPMPAKEFASERAIAEQRAVHNVETGVVNENGAVIWTSVSAVPVKFPDWKVVIVTADITERKGGEEALRRAEENFRHSLDGSPLGVRIVTAEGETIYANRAILDIYGFSSLEELRTTPVKKRYTPESYAEFQNRLEKRQRGEDPPSEYEVSIVRKNGEVRHLLVSRKELFWNGKKQYQALYRDITERKRAEEELRASLREKEVLLREVHHRVKNNMQVISSLFNLQAGYTTNEECRKILKEGQMRIRSMSLVHEKLYQSRDLSKIDLAGYIQSLATHLFQVYLVNPAQVRMEMEFEDVPLDINSAVPCGLILNELISNALKHAFPEGRTGVIKIGLRCGPEGAVELRVADDGVGLPEGLDFRKAESFGLQIVNLLVDQLEAAIDLDRTKGTVFTMTFRELKYAPRA